LIDVEDWKSHTRYCSYNYDAMHPSVMLFWEYLASLDQVGLSSVLKFTTGTSRLPVGGFSSFKESEKFQLWYKEGEDSDTNLIKLPTAATCFMSLFLPAYTSIEQLRSRFEYALIMSQGQGFEEGETLMQR
jgi:hypothetical protein